MHTFLLRAPLLMARLALGVAALVAAGSFASAQQPAPTASQSDPDKPVTPPDSYRVVMENDRVRMIEIHIKPHSKVNVDSPAERERFLYMLSDGALILAPPGKTPYEFAMHAGETAVFPAVSPTVANDTNSPVRALMVEIKTGSRSAAAGRGKAARFGTGKSRGKFAAKSGSRKVSVAGTKSKSKQAAKPRNQAKSSLSTRPVANAPLNLRKANAKPSKVSRKGRGNDG